MAKGKNYKNAKNVKNNVEVVSTSDEMKKLGKIVVSLFIIIGIFYIIAVYVSKNTGNLKFVPSKSVESNISYETILASDILSKDGEYYVLVNTDSKNPWLETYVKAIEDYKSKDEHLKFYKVDLEDALNKRYVGEENNLEKDNLKFTKKILLKIKDGNIVENYSDSIEIYSHITSL